MVPDFFAEPILNSPYAYPGEHWELDDDGQPTNRIIQGRRAFAEFTDVYALGNRLEEETTASLDQVVASDAGTTAGAVP